MTSQVYIIILNYKNWRDVVECLDSILHLDYRDYKIFVVDNNSQNDSLQEMMKWIDLHSQIDGAKVSYQYYTAQQFSQHNNIENTKKISFIQNSHNNGFAAGNNLVLQQVAGKDAYVWLLNPD